MNLDDLKKLSRDKISKFENERIANAIPYTIEDVGELKLAKISPKVFYDIVIRFGGKADTSDGITPDNIAMNRELLKASCVEPILDDEAIDIIIELLGFDWFDIVKTIMDMTSTNAGIDEKIDDMENFSEDKGGHLKEPTPV